MWMRTRGAEDSGIAFAFRVRLNSRRRQRWRRRSQSPSRRPPHRRPTDGRRPKSHEISLRGKKSNGICHSFPSPTPNAIWRRFARPIAVSSLSSIPSSAADGRRTDGGQEENLDLVVVEAGGPRPAEICQRAVQQGRSNLDL